MSRAAARHDRPNQDKVLVVEDDRGLRALLQEELEDHDLDVRAVRDAEAASEALTSWRPELVLSDLRLPGRSGLEFLSEVRQLDEKVRPAFVVITAFGSISQAVEALRGGADDFLTKPLDFDHLRARIDRLLGTRRLRRDDGRSFHGLEGFHGILARSPAMQALFERARKVARARGPVLILGESGVGKELVARALHTESPRREAPLVPVNCASVPEALLESEFFGHASGAFTGATRARRGLFSAAAGGTILLDEIGELPLALQAKLLRVLQEGRVRPVGSDRDEEVDVRVVAATNRDLEREVSRGRFREDLFFRLALYTLEVPPLRDRGEDIELLARNFLARGAARAGRTTPDLAADALSTLVRYRFPGNVRELENAVEHALTFARDDTIRSEDLPARMRRVAVVTAATSRTRTESIPGSLVGDGRLPTLEELRRRYVDHVLSLTEGNKRRAAALLGISRRTLYRQLDRQEDEESGDE